MKIFNITFAIIIGVLNHTLFCLAVGLMGYMLFWGMSKSMLPSLSYGLTIDLLLVISFPLIHSYLLSENGKKLLASIIPGEIGKNLSTTTFTLISSIQLCIIFLFWTPIGGIWWMPSGFLMILWCIAYIGSWLLLAVSIWEAGVGLQSGSIGWLSVLRNRKATYPPIPYTGLHGVCRQPIYLSFALIVLTGPVWGLDHLIIASFWVAYCLIGPRFKEKRLLVIAGEQYRSYQARVPYIISFKGLYRSYRSDNLTNRDQRFVH